jgi:hypothetical protein
MKYIIISFFCASAAFIVYAIQTELIIINNERPVYTAPKQLQPLRCTFYWHEHILQPEDALVIRSDDTQENLLHIINGWLIFIHNEGMHKKVHAETAMLSPSENELFISFDRQPFSKQQSIGEKIGFIQNLCKTIGPHTAAHKIRFLVRHAPMHDNYLDFSSGWSIRETT